jgi:hypothetical protein
LLGHALGGDQLGLAMLITFPVFLIASGVIGIRGSRHFAGDVAAVTRAMPEAAGSVPTSPAH